MGKCKCEHWQSCPECTSALRLAQIEIERLTQRNDELRTANGFAELEAEIERLRSFALAVVCYDDHYFEDCDGGYLQATAVKYGIAYKVTMEAPCGEYCACADTILYDDWPLECYRIAPEILAAKGE